MTISDHFLTVFGQTLAKLNGTDHRNVEQNPRPRKLPEKKPNRPKTAEHKSPRCLVQDKSIRNEILFALKRTVV